MRFTTPVNWPKIALNFSPAGFSFSHSSFFRNRYLQDTGQVKRGPCDRANSCLTPSQLPFFLGMRACFLNLESEMVTELLA